MITFAGVGNISGSGMFGGVGKKGQCYLLLTLGAIKNTSWEKKALVPNKLWAFSLISLKSVGGDLSTSLDFWDLYLGLPVHN